MWCWEYDAGTWCWVCDVGFVMMGTSAVAHVCVKSCRLYNTRPAHFMESNNYIHQPNSIDVRRRKKRRLIPRKSDRTEDVVRCIAAFQGPTTYCSYRVAPAWTEVSSYLKPPPSARLKYPLAVWFLIVYRTFDICPTASDFLRGFDLSAFLTIQHNNHYPHN